MNNRLPFSLGFCVSGIGGIILVLMFFLPWVALCDAEFSGNHLAFGLTPASTSPTPLCQPNAGLLPENPLVIALVLVGGIVALGTPLTEKRWTSQQARLVQATVMTAAGLGAGLALGYIGFWVSNLASQPNTSSLIKLLYGLPSSGLGAAGILVGGITNLIALYRLRPPLAPLSEVAADEPPSEVVAAKAVTPTRAWLRGQKGELVGESVEITGDYITIGRSAENRIYLHDPKISRQHAIIRYYDGQYYIQDLQSLSGIMVNNQTTQAQALQDGDLITIGNVVLEFRAQ